MELETAWRIIERACPHLENLLAALCTFSRQSPIIDPDEKAWKICQRNTFCYPDIPNPSWDGLARAERDQRFTNSHCISLMNNAQLRYDGNNDQLIRNIRYTIRHFSECNHSTQEKLGNLFIAAVNSCGCNCAN